MAEQRRIQIKLTFYRVVGQPRSGEMSIAQIAPLIAFGAKRSAEHFASLQTLRVDVAVSIDISCLRHFR